jgi:hypothetical protein
MDGRKYFILANEQVKGPFDRDALNSALSQFTSPLIWGRGQSEWLTPDQFEKMLVDLESTVNRQRLQNEREWRIRIGDQELRPMFYSQMIDYLKNQADFSTFLIWTDGYNEWKEIYQVHKIMDDLGVSRRRHPRVPIMGQIEAEGTSGSFSARALSISEGGLGMTESPPTSMGDKYKVTLKSPNLYTPLHATAEVVFTGHDGYVGMKFTALPSESKSAIIEYVKKFTTSNPIGGGTNTGFTTN